MLMPMLWSNNDIFDEMDNFFNDGFFGGSGLMPREAKPFDSTSGPMRTDVIEKDNCYQLEAELPGFNKEDIKIDLKNDTLTISASHNENKDEKDENGKYIRRERRSSSYQRSFHVEGLKPEDIIAQYRNGVLTVNLPKKEAIPEKEEAIQIEVKD
ncbi:MULTISPECIES: Hsp20/alpha crystallin family protein [unclassified Butyrivibrio]|uniref:Hsp20/alpha crystallin family protein n=1 Tax=unclassified Butyrivibrio TaxID=2639466 RepID=UPI0003B688E1|nr:MULTISPECIES: Hsp20/alpha crystallin family protein [unclassified Butyrivibrio]